MADRMSDRLKKVQPVFIDEKQWHEDVATIHDAMAELDRREAIVAAAEAWAKAYRAAVDDMNMSRMKAQSHAELTLLALLPPPAAALKG